MNNIKKYKYEIFAFIVEAISMMLELCASRTLTPYFGDSNIVWTSVIGIILLSASIGNYFGGKIADNKDINKSISKIILISAILIIYIPLFSDIILYFISMLDLNVKIGAVLATIILFLPSSITLGLISPIILKIKVTNLENNGQVSGNIHAITTIGGITGTFLGGFVLVPLLGTKEILCILSFITILLLLFFSEKKLYQYIILFLLMVIIFIVYYTNYNNEAKHVILNNQPGISFSVDSQYAPITITNIEENNEIVRYMQIGGGHSSATYTNPDKRNELVFEYTQYYDLMFDVNPKAQDIMMIGGGGYSYPKYLISHFDNINLDVIEIDKKVTQLALDYFYLDELIEQYDPDGKRLNLINEDGKVYLNENTKKYDIILNDAFAGGMPVESLTTLETICDIKKNLNEDGAYLTNIIASINGERSNFLKAEVKTLKQVFRNVYIIPTIECTNDKEVLNFMVIATDKEMNFENNIKINFEDAIILTDDYSPVDMLNE